MRISIIRNEEFGERELILHRRNSVKFNTIKEKGFTGPRDMGGYTSQLSRINVFNFGQPPPSLKTLQTRSVRDSHSERSTTCSQGQCKTKLAKLD